MMGFDRKFLVSGLAYAVLGLAFGIYMGMSQNHSQLVTHAHILLIGFAISVVYGVIHKLWLAGVRPGVATLQFVLHHAGALIMLASLFLLSGQFVPEETIGPVLGLSSIAVLLGMLLMLFMVIRAPAGKV
ncbi:hypothetical protein [Collimonas sp. OK412]|jgi:drug/metabolite transporter (DMT)-like permease|uniref:hypothetical protein n=1 Tax=Collimonas sp. (strain OK412) TaxID=1801619 RepID=UPI001C315DD8|nr:hypothetical protein [Collimonas sp. OK412]